MSSEPLSIDTRGLVCPQPVIELGKAVRANVQRPLLIRLVSDDPTSAHDVPAWCRMTNNELVSSERADADYIFVVSVSK